MTELYLIAHKVRGQPAFDIAQRLRIGDEEGWIIPTSGHRAYPYDWQAITELLVLSEWKPMPTDLEDHYPAKASADQARPSAKSLLEALGLNKPKPPATPIHRRL